MKRNVAGQHVAAQMVSATDGSPVTSSVSVVVSKDGGAQAAGQGTLTHRGSGHFDYAPTQAETDADHVVFQFSGGGSVPVLVQVYTSHPQSGDAYARLGAPAGASVSADIAAVKAQADEVRTDTEDIQSRLPAALVDGRIDANVGAISGDAAAADNLEAAADGTGYNLGGGAIVAESVTGDVGGSVQGSVGSLAAQAKADVNNEVDAALAEYDGATGTELANAVSAILAAIGGLNDLSAQDVQDAVAALTADGLTLPQILGVIVAALAAKLSGADTTTIKVRNLQDTLDRITATVDEHGNRSAISLDLTGL